ncbi:MAG TPA: sodium:proton antiporter NhaD [Chloroflexota bacterium]|nr:sodium:proton antiporter NhaD [Chloroflexota bacterium]
MEQLNLTSDWTGIAAVICFAVAYGIAMAEERLQVRKSVPVLVGALGIWVLVGVAYAEHGAGAAATDAARHTIVDFAELMLFLIPAMTFVNTLEERGLFDALRVWLIQRGLSLRALFWVTGALAFVVSPIGDNLTTALFIGAVAMAVGRGHTAFITLACINVVVAANAGGAFSPFGDITTLMVWQAGKVAFSGFFAMLAPSLVNWLVPAAVMSLAIRGDHPPAVNEQLRLEPGALSVLALLFGTIAMTVSLHNFLALPPAVGMMGGLALLKAYSYLENARYRGRSSVVDEFDDVFAAGDAEPVADPGSSVGARVAMASSSAVARAPAAVPAPKPLDIFALLEKIEWDTLMFFYGVLMGVGGLGALGYLALTSQVLYGALGPTAANVLVGVLSAVIDNVPVMFAVLQMSPDMPQGQWLLVTLTAGVGGSLLSIGSAAGVALMGQARGVYTFGAHLRWTWAIGLGFVASIAIHLWLNASLF